MRGFALFGVAMKVIQFKKIGNRTGNHDEVARAVGGSISYATKCGSTDIQLTYERDNKSFPLQFNDWIVDADGVVFVFSPDQYQKFLTLLPPRESLGDLIGKAVREVIIEQRHGGLLR